MSLFDDIHKTPIMESVSDKKEAILNKIESECEKKGYTIKIGKKDREVFLQGSGSVGGGPGGPNSLCIAGMGKENWDNVYNLIKYIIKDEKDFKVTQDNYFTIFLDYTAGQVIEEKVNLVKAAAVIGAGYIGINAAIKMSHKEEFAKMEKIKEHFSLMSYFVPYEELKKNLRNPISDIVSEYSYAGEVIFKYNTRYNRIVWIDSIYAKFKDYYELEVSLHTLGDKLGNDIWMKINDLYEKIYGDEPVNESVSPKYPSVKSSENDGFDQIPAIKAIKCFKGSNGCDNTIVRVDTYSKPLRAKSEVCVFKNDKIFLRMKDNFYKLPGGTWDRDESPLNAAIRETREEARIEIKDPEYVTTRIELFGDRVPKYLADIPEKYRWCGYYCNVYLATYNGPYNGHIDKIDEDRDLTYNGKFYPIKKVYDKLYPEHKRAVDQYLSSYYKMESVITEAAGDTYVMKNEVYPIVEKTLSDPVKDKKFRNAVRSFIDRNSENLHTSGPVNMVPFTDADKQVFFEIFDIDKNDLIHSIDRMTKGINDKANWKLLKQNPVFCLFYECIRYYTLKKDEKGVNTALAIYALSVYPSVFAMLFQFGTNADVMKFTMDNLSAKYLMKQTGNVFGGLMKSIQNSYKFLKNEFIDSPDREVVRFITRIRNDQKSLFKNIANNYYKNHARGLRASTQSDTYGDNQLIDDNTNNTTIVEDTTRKIVLSLVTNGVDLTRATAAAKIANISLVELRFYLTKIITEDRSDELRQFVESIIFAFLYQEHHEPYEINEKKFLQFAIEFFRKTNTNDKNVNTFKTLLDKWSSDTGLNEKYRRLASQIAYKRGIYLYIILCIQYYNQ